MKVFHPTQMLETGYDILFFWVARMILMTGYTLGQIPFEKVYLHGLVRDGKGQKLSKSLGNAMDPLEMTAKYSADATRMALIAGTGAGTDSKISEDKIKGYRNFGNKLWNITRFILESTQGISYDENFSAWTEADKELRSTRDIEIKEATKEMDEYRVHLAAERLYQYAWATLADKLIEESKPILKEGTDEIAKASRAHFLIETLGILIKSLHPFIPFVTEELWNMLPQKKTLLIVEKWPL
jgi:valyl-tRNA synthetase